MAQQQPNHNIYQVKEYVSTLVSSQINRTVVSLIEAKNLFLGGFDGCGINMNSFNNFRNKWLFFRSSSSSHRSSSFSLGDEDEDEDDTRMVPLLFDPSQPSSQQPFAQHEPSENGSSVYMTPPSTFLFPPRAISFFSKKREEEEERIQKEELATFGSGKEIAFGYQAPLLPSLTPVLSENQPIKNKKQEEKNQFLNLINYDADEEKVEGGGKDPKKVPNTPQILHVLLKEEEEEEELDDNKIEDSIENTNHLEQSNLFLQTPFEQLAQIAAAAAVKNLNLMLHDVTIVILAVLFLIPVYAFLGAKLYERYCCVDGRLDRLVDVGTKILQEFDKRPVARANAEKVVQMLQNCLNEEEQDVPSKNNFLKMEKRPKQKEREYEQGEVSKVLWHPAVQKFAASQVTTTKPMDIRKIINQHTMNLQPISFSKKKPPVSFVENILQKTS